MSFDDGGYGESLGPLVTLSTDQFDTAREGKGVGEKDEGEDGQMGKRTQKARFVG